MRVDTEKTGVARTIGYLAWVVVMASVILKACCKN